MILYPVDGRSIELDETLAPGRVISHLLIGPINLEAWQCGVIRKYKCLGGPCILEAGDTLVFDRRLWHLDIRRGDGELMV